MVKKFEDIKQVKMDNFKGGKQYVTKIPSIEEGEFSEYANVIGKLVLRPGATIGYHEHKGDGEVMTILSGEGKYIEDGKEYMLSTGDVTICNEGHMHSMENASETEDLVIFVAVIKE